MGNGYPQIHVNRALLWSGASAVALIRAYRESQNAWGRSTGKFHFKDDLFGDHLALSDETSHLFAAFQLTKFLNSAYQWVGLDARKACQVAAIETWLLTFLTEYPIDSYNTDQGFGSSDLMFNTAGVVIALVRINETGPSRWDLKMSVKPKFFDSDSRLIAYSERQYDDYIYWLTVRPSMHKNVPLVLGVGYSTHHPNQDDIIKEVHFGIGTTLQDLGGMLGESVYQALSPLSFFYFNVETKISWE